MLTEELNAESPGPGQVHRERQPIPPTRWQENHGNLLIVFVGIVFLFGTGILFYRQNRFIPVRFPESDMIEAPIEPKLTEEDRNNALTIKVTGAANDVGLIMLAVYDSESKFSHRSDAVFSSMLPIINGEAICEIPISQLPDQFAVAVYHDENADLSLNRNHLGIPTERYGFSRNARGSTGAPTFKQAMIKRPEAGTTIDLVIR